MRQAELARLALVWLLTTDGPVAWIGTAESPEGTADVLEVKPANGVSDPPLSRSVHAHAADDHVVGTAQRGAATSETGASGRRNAPRGGGPARRRAAPGQTTLELHMADYKTVNGIKLPHLITRGTEGHHAGGAQDQELQDQSRTSSPTRLRNDTRAVGRRLAARRLAALRAGARARPPRQAQLRVVVLDRHGRRHSGGDPSPSTPPGSQPLKVDGGRARSGEPRRVAGRARCSSTSSRRASFRYDAPLTLRRGLNNQTVTLEDRRLPGTGRRRRNGGAGDAAAPRRRRCSTRA